MRFAPPKADFGIHLFMLTLCTGLLCALVSTASESADADTPVPAALKPAPHEREAFTWHAIGVQLYECRADANGRLAWVFVAPQADLFNEKNEKVGMHGAGPQWSALDGSRVVGIEKARAPGETAADIPLLLLSARSTGASGRLDGVSSVQRLDTHGGKPPANGCQAQADAGRRLREGYTARYVFFVAAKP